MFLIVLISLVIIIGLELVDFPKQVSKLLDFDWMDPQSLRTVVTEGRVVDGRGPLLYSGGICPLLQVIWW